MSYSRHQQTRIVQLEKLPVNASSTIQFEESTVPVVVRFGDLFSLPDVDYPLGSSHKNLVPAVPNFDDGVLKQLWVRVNGPTELIPDEGVVKPFFTRTVKSNTPGTGKMILFRYPHEVDRWTEVFRDIAISIGSNIPADTILVIPTFGTNNGISFYDSALGIFTGLRHELGDPNSNFQKLYAIHVVTPFSEDQTLSSCRTIAHLTNMISIYNKYGKSDTEWRCLICTEAVPNIVLPCGHMVLLCRTLFYHVDTWCCVRCVFENFKDTEHHKGVSCAKSLTRQSVDAFDHNVWRKRVVDPRNPRLSCRTFRADTPAFGVKIVRVTLSQYAKSVQGTSPKKW